MCWVLLHCPESWPLRTDVMRILFEQRCIRSISRTCFADSVSNSEVKRKVLDLRVQSVELALKENRLT